jgi:hypothetical protein
MMPKFRAEVHATFDVPEPLFTQMMYEEGDLNDTAWNEFYKGLKEGRFTMDNIVVTEVIEE